MPSSRRITRSIGLCRPRRLLKRARISATVGHHVRTDAVHDELGVPLHQRHQRGEPARRSPAAPASAPCRARTCATPGSRTDSASALTRGAQPVGELLAADLGGVHERLHLAEEVAAHPRHGGELRAVGHLVQADPQPEVARYDLELALHLDDVRRDEQQLARVGGEHLELAEHPAGQVGEHRAGLYAGEPGPDHRRSARPARDRPVSGSASGVMTVRRPSMLTRGPVAPVDHAHRVVPDLSAPCFGELDDMPGRLVGEAPQLGDDLGRLGQGDLRATLAERTGGGGGQIPIHELRHAVNRTR